MNKEKQKTLLSKLIKASQEIDRIGKANYIHLSEEFIQKQADEKGVTFDETVEIIENELKPKQ
jgi:phosphopentomutase